VTRHVFLDETKRHGYVVAAAAVQPGDLAPLRSVVRGLVLPGQRRVHMKDERDSRPGDRGGTVDAGAMTVDARTTAKTHRDGRLRCPRPRSPTSMSMG